MLTEPQEFREKILLEPVSQGADTLRIISGYASHIMASWHISQVNERIGRSVNIELIVGMCKKDMLFRPVHEGFREIMNTSPFFTCRYISEAKAVHTNLYLWEKEGKPFAAYAGSANYTQPAFFGQNDEAMFDCNPEEAEAYLNQCEACSMLCTDPEIEKYITITDTPRRLSIYWDEN